MALQTLSWRIRLRLSHSAACLVDADGRRDQERPFAMVPRSVRRMLRCGECFRLWCLLDETQRDTNAPVRGSHRVAEEMGWQPRTAQKHLWHLFDAGLVKLEPEPTRAWGQTKLVVVHSPARSRRGPVRDVPGVWEEPPRRWKSPPNLSTLSNARRVAHRVRDFDSEAVGDGRSPLDIPDAMRDAPQPEARCASRPVGDAMCDAHRVSGSPSLKSDLPTPARKAEGWNGAEEDGGVEAERPRTHALHGSVPSGLDARDAAAVTNKIDWAHPFDGSPKAQIADAAAREAGRLRAMGAERR